MKYIISITLLVSLCGCDLLQEINAIESMRDDEKVWVFMQLNVPEESDGTESYYYYAQVSKKLYDAISYNEIQSGFVLLENVKYWGNDDLIHDYKDFENAGELIFRIENIIKVDPVNVEPMVGVGYEQFEEPGGDAGEEQGGE